MSFVLNAVIFAVTAIIVIRFFFRDGQWDVRRGCYAMRFFTTQSNILCAVAALLMCLFPQARMAWLVKYIGTAAVTVTMLTVFLFLAPSIGKGGLGQLLKGSDLFMHLITPLLALISFLFLERRGMSFAVSLLGMLPVLLYGPLYLYRIRFAPKERAWEDFYGFNKGGKWPVSLVMMGMGTFLICMALMVLQNL